MVKNLFFLGFQTKQVVNDFEIFNKSEGSFLVTLTKSLIFFKQKQKSFWWIKIDVPKSIWKEDFCVLGAKS